VYEIRKKCGAVPAGKRRAAIINKVDFNSFFYDILRQASEKRFFRR
jgi:hypothetical protein